MGVATMCMRPCACNHVHATVCMRPCACDDRSAGGEVVQVHEKTVEVVTVTVEVVTVEVGRWTWSCACTHVEAALAEREVHAVHQCERQRVDLLPYRASPRASALAVPAVLHRNAATEHGFVQGDLFEIEQLIVASLATLRAGRHLGELVSRSKLPRCLPETVDAVQ
eukprot:1965411-Prymnesium_polylepis.1